MTEWVGQRVRLVRPMTCDTLHLAPGAIGIVKERVRMPGKREGLLGRYYERDEGYEVHFEIAPSVFVKALIAADQMDALQLWPSGPGIGSN